MPLVHHSFSPFRIHFLLLRLAAEHLQRLWHADRLVGREERGDRAVYGRHQLDRLHVGQLRQAEAAVLAGDLDAERADVLQSLDHRRGDLTLAVDLVGIDARHQPVQLVEERLGPLGFDRVLERVGMNQVHSQLPEEQIPHEARGGPLLFASRLGDGARFVGADLGLGGGGGGSHIK